MDQATTTPPTTSSNKKTSKLLIAVVFLLVLGCAVLGWFYYQERQKVLKYQEAAFFTLVIAKTVNDTVYDQFTKVDENAHGQAAEACLQIEETKPEYKALVKKGICDPHSDVFKPDYSAFTPMLQQNAQELNKLLTTLGHEPIDDFSDKPTENYIQKTGQDVFYEGE